VCSEREEAMAEKAIMKKAIVMMGILWNMAVLLATGFVGFIFFVWLFPSNDRRFGLYYSREMRSEKGGGGMDSEAVREIFLPRWEDCLEYLRKKRWKEGVKCPYCGTGTIFERHHFPIEEMFYILKEMEAKSTLQISEELGRDFFILCVKFMR